MVRSFDLITFKTGITHVQLLPVYDFGSVDEEDQWKAYNWGYDPVQYNVPEGSYASDPQRSLCANLRNSKILLQPITRLILVSSWMWSTITSTRQMSMHLNRSFPVISTAIMQKESGPMEPSVEMMSASERSMVRHYIKQSLKQWVSLYGFDGFQL